MLTVNNVAATETQHIPVKHELVFGGFEHWTYIISQSNTSRTRVVSIVIKQDFHKKWGANLHFIQVYSHNHHSMVKVISSNLPDFRLLLITEWTNINCHQCHRRSVKYNDLRQSEQHTREEYLLAIRDD